MFDTVLRGWMVLLLTASCVRIPPPPQPKNLLLITLDTFRADYIGVYGATGDPSPSIDALAQAGLRFDRAYTTAPLTAPAHASILTGRYPSEHGVLYNAMQLEAPMVYNPASTVLSEHLRAQGFRTGAIVTAMPLVQGYGFAKGFDTHQMVPTSNPDPEVEYGGSSADALAAARRWLGDRAEGRFFLWVHLYEAHVPYSSPAAIHARLGSAPGRIGMEDVGTASPAAFRAAYRAEVLEVDDAIGGFVRMLEELELRDSTVLSMVSDHGEYLGEDDLYGHHGVREEVMRIPMLINGPGVAPAVHTGAVSAVDLAPTLLEFMGLPALPGASGRSLAGQDRTSSVPIFAEYRHIRLYDVGKTAESRDGLLAVWADQHKMVRSWLSAEDRVFELSSGGEQEIPAADTAKTKALTRELEHFPIAQSPVSSAPLGVPQTGIELLRTLGYIE